MDLLSTLNLLRDGRIKRIKGKQPFRGWRPRGHLASLLKASCVRITTLVGIAGCVPGKALRKAPGTSVDH